MAKGKWRPEGWDSNIFSLRVAQGRKLEPHERDNALTTIKLARESFEAGADAMLEALKNSATPTGLPYTAYANERKGWLVFIPDDN